MTLRDENCAQLLALCSTTNSRHLMRAACFGAMALHSAWSQPVWDPELARLDESVRRAAHDDAIQLLLTHDVQLVAAATGALRLQDNVSCLMLDRLTSTRPVDPSTLRSLMRAAGRRHALRLAWIDPNTQRVRISRSSPDQMRAGTERHSGKHGLLTSTNLEDLCGDHRFCPQACIDILCAWRDLGDLVLLLGRGFDVASALSPEHRHFETVGSLARRLSLGLTALLRDDAGKPYGALCWSWISERSADRLRRQPQRPTSFYEMNDGQVFLLEAAAFESADDTGALIARRPPALPETDIALHRNGESLRTFRWTDTDDCIQALFAVRNDANALRP